METLFQSRDYVFLLRRNGLQFVPITISFFLHFRLKSVGIVLVYGLVLLSFTGYLRFENFSIIYLSQR